MLLERFARAAERQLPHGISSVVNTRLRRSSSVHNSPPTIVAVYTMMIGAVPPSVDVEQPVHTDLEAALLPCLAQRVVDQLLASIDITAWERPRSQRGSIARRTRTSRSSSVRMIDDRDLRIHVEDESARADQPFRIARFERAPAPARRRVELTSVQCWSIPRLCAAMSILKVARLGHPVLRAGRVPSISR